MLPSASSPSWKPRHMTGQEFKHKVEATVRGARVTKKRGHRNFYVQVFDSRGRLISGKVAVNASWVDRLRLSSDVDPLCASIRESIRR